MNSTAARCSKKGFALHELLTVLLILVLLFVSALYLQKYYQADARRWACVNNVKQIGLACKTWQNDHGGGYPMARFSIMNGAEAFRYFQVMSNELSTPYNLTCPADTRVPTSQFAQLNNQNVSYFVGLDASDGYPKVFLSGDRNISAPTKPENGILKIRPGDKIAWTAEMHKKIGNILCVDGSVQSWLDAALQKGLQDSGDSTNVWRLALLE